MASCLPNPVSGEEKSYSDYLTNVHVYLPSKVDDSWVEVTVAHCFRPSGSLGIKTPSSPIPTA
jgi:hypothetical protein